jgi:hypothetical protein
VFVAPLQQSLGTEGTLESRLTLFLINRGDRAKAFGGGKFAMGFIWTNAKIGDVLGGNIGPLVTSRISLSSAVKEVGVEDMEED